MGDVGELDHFYWVGAVITFVVGAILKNSMPNATVLPVAGALVAGLAAGWIVRRIEFRHRSSA